MNEMNRRQMPDYGAKERDVIAFLGGKHAIVLATSLDGRVTTRTVSFINDGPGILFMLWGHNTKFVQMLGNPHVALWRDQVQMEGRAAILGSRPILRIRGTLSSSRRSIRATSRRSRTSPGCSSCGRSRPRSACSPCSMVGSTWPT